MRVKAVPSAKEIDVPSNSNKSADVGDQLTLLGDCGYDGEQGCDIFKKIDNIDTVKIRRGSNACQLDTGNLLLFTYNAVNLRSCCQTLVKIPYIL